MNLEIIGQCGIGKTHLWSKINKEKKFDIIHPSRIRIIIFRFKYIYKVCFQNKLNIFNLLRKDMRFLINSISYRYAIFF